MAKSMTAWLVGFSVFSLFVSSFLLLLQSWLPTQGVDIESTELVNLLTTNETTDELTESFSSLSTDEIQEGNDEPFLTETQSRTASFMRTLGGFTNLVWDMGDDWNIPTPIIIFIVTLVFISLVTAAIRIWRGVNA